MKWFDKWIAKKIAARYEEAIEIRKDSSIQRSDPRLIDARGMNFTVHRANGGFIIETRKYDIKRDQTDNGLHIITDDKDLGEEIGKIITYETLRN